jgi:prolyl-tRNA editing enzyme YbaK/EbsC (Cys-tRNA(Pro) deacylase)
MAVADAFQSACFLHRHPDRHVQAAVGDRHVRLATEEELLRDFPGFELGALPPLGSLLGAPLYVDQEVLQHETVVFAAGARPNRCSSRRRTCSSTSR